MKPFAPEVASNLCERVLELVVGVVDAQVGHLDFRGEREER